MDERTDQMCWSWLVLDVFRICKDSLTTWRVGFWFENQPSFRQATALRVLGREGIIAYSWHHSDSVSYLKSLPLRICVYRACFPLRVHVELCSLLALWLCANNLESGVVGLVMRSGFRLYSATRSWTGSQSLSSLSKNMSHWTQHASKSDAFLVIILLDGSLFNCPTFISLLGELARIVSQTQTKHRIGQKNRYLSSDRNLHSRARQRCDGTRPLAQARKLNGVAADRDRSSLGSEPVKVRVSFYCFYVFSAWPGESRKRNQLYITDLHIWNPKTGQKRSSRFHRNERIFSKDLFTLLENVPMPAVKYCKVRWIAEVQWCVKLIGNLSRSELLWHVSPFPFPSSPSTCDPLTSSVPPL